MKYGGILFFVIHTDSEKRRGLTMFYWERIKVDRGCFFGEKSTDNQLSTSSLFRTRYSTRELHT